MRIVIVVPAECFHLGIKTSVLVVGRLQLAPVVSWSLREVILADQFEEISVELLIGSCQVIGSTSC